MIVDVDVDVIGSVIGAAMLADVLAGESPAGGACPVATVAISGSGKGDRPVGSPDVKVLMRRANNLTGRSESELIEPREHKLGAPNPSVTGEGKRRRRRNWVHAAGGLSGVMNDGMPGENGQRKHGTSRGSPRPAGTAKASRISQEAKSRCAREWGGWGRLSVDGPGQHNLDRSEDPWGRAVARVVVPNTDERFSLITGKMSARQDGYEGRTQTRWRSSWTPHGKAPSDMPALEPYWGKPAVRNLRGDDGNVGIIRSPVRAIVLPDCTCT